MPIYNIQLECFDIEADDEDSACRALGQSLASCKYDFMVLEVSEQEEDDG